MAKRINSRIKVGGNGVAEATLRDTVTNQLVVFADEMNYDPVTDMVTLISCGHTLRCGAQGVSDEFDGTLRFSNGCSNFKSRHVKIDNVKYEDGTYEYVNTYVSYSRIYTLVKALCNKSIAIKEIDGLVHNHLDNKGWEEALITDGRGLYTRNYELCTQKQNKRHADVWYLLRDWGIESTFSALNSQLVLSLKQTAESAVCQTELIHLLNLTFKKQIKSGEFQFVVVEEINYDGLTKEQIKALKDVERMFR